MEIITSIDTMPKEEIELYEKLIPNSIKLLQLLETSYKEKPVYLRYISVLFGFRSSNDEYEKLSGIANAIHSRGSSGYIIETYSFQKTITNYLTNLDSTLDYLDKFAHQVRDVEIAKLKFQRKLDKVSVQISGFRNQVIHEQIAGISWPDEKARIVSCTAYASSTAAVYRTLKLNFESGKSYDLSAFLELTQKNTQKLVNNAINSTTTLSIMSHQR